MALTREECPGANCSLGPSMGGEGEDYKASDGYRTTFGKSPGDRGRKICIYDKGSPWFSFKMGQVSHEERHRQRGGEVRIHLLWF